MKYSVMQLKDFKIKSMDASVRASIREELLSEGFNLSEIELLIHCITNKPDDHTWLNEIIKSRLIPNDKPLWRGVPVETKQVLNQGIDIITFDKVVSASYDKNIALHFASGLEYNTQVIFEFKAPMVFNFQEYAIKALRCKEYNPSFKFPDSHRYRNMELVSDEQEVMIPAGSVFRIADRYEYKKYSTYTIYTLDFEGFNL